MIPDTIPFDSERSTAFRGGPLPLSNKVPSYGGSMDFARAFDGSNWTTGTGPGGDLTADDIRHMITGGINLGMIQALIPPPGYPRSGDSQLSARMGRAVLDGGMSLDAYLYWIEGGTPFPQKIALMEGLEVRRWHVDLEEKPELAGYAINASVEYAIKTADMAPSLLREPSVLYTAWWWVEWFLQHGGNIALLKDHPLWWVWDDGRADSTLDRIPAEKRPSAFGLDDNNVIMVQYLLSTSVMGVSGIDLSVLSQSEGDKLMAIPPVPDDYRQKFTLSGPYDWPGVAANLEGIITDLMQRADQSQSSPSDAQNTLQGILSYLQSKGYTVTPPPAR